MLREDQVNAFQQAIEQSIFNFLRMDTEIHTEVVSEHPLKIKTTFCLRNPSTKKHEVIGMDVVELPPKTS